MKKKFVDRNVTKEKMKGVIALLCLFLFSVNGLAAVEDILTLNKAIEITLEKNQDIKQVSNQVQLGKVTVRQKKLNFYPQLQLSSSFTQQYSKSADTTTNEYTGHDSRSLNFSLSSTLNLFNGFYDKASLQKSKLELKSQLQNLSRSKEAAVFETIQSYIQAVLAEEYVKVEQENLAAQEMQLELIQDFFNAGKRPITDLYQQKAEISKSRYQLLEAERNFEVNKLSLMQIMGLQPISDYYIAHLDINGLMTDLSTLNTEDENKRIGAAMANRKDLKAQKMQVKAAKKAVKVAQAGFWPTLSLFADLGTNYNSTIEYANFSNQFFDNNLNASIGLSLTVPVFDKGAAKTNTVSARIEVKNQELVLEKMENQISIEVQQAIKDLQTAKRQVGVAEAQLSYAKSALESIEARYKVQASTMVELTQARATYLEASYNNIKAKYNLLIQAITTAFYGGDFQTMISIINR